MLKVYFFGYGGSSVYAENLRPLIKSLDMELITIHEHNNADIKWNRLTVLDELKKADIIILPCNWDKQPAKSNNRLTQSMSLGKAVICSPLPAYLAIEQKYPGCCVIAKTDEDWKEALLALKDDKLRQQISEKALEAAKDYSIDTIAKQWINVIDGKDDKVDIIIPTRNNDKHLNLCIESIKQCTSNYNLIIVRDKQNFSQAINEGLKQSKAPYVCICNDDIIVSKGWLQSMIETPDADIINPLSNCNKTWRHDYNISIGGIELLPGMNTIDQITPIVKDIYDYKSPYKEIVQREWLPFFCTLIKRKVIDAVGLLDESFVNGCEDLDYSKRAVKLGFKLKENYKSFVFHFGGVSRKAHEIEGPEKHKKEDQINNLYFKEKHDKETVVLYSGPAWEKWDHRNLITGIGGSEVHQICLAREFDKLGYRVISFCDCNEAIKDGNIQYFKYTDFSQWISYNYIDYLIIERTTEPLQYPVRVGKTFIQIHDVFMLNGVNTPYQNKVTKFCALSDWHIDFASKYHSIPKERFVLTSNGINLDRFNSKVEKNPYRLHWSSSWDRGLDNVLYLFPFLKKEIPQLELHCFYGTYNWKESCKKRNDVEGLKKIAELEAAVKQLGVFTYGRIGQDELAIEMQKASLLLYPQWFSETYFITGVECQAARCPIICNKYAGVTTTLKDSAIMLGNGDAWWPYTTEGRIAFYNETLKMFRDKEYWSMQVDKGLENARSKTWANCALKWQKLFKGE